MLADRTAAEELRNTALKKYHMTLADLKWLSDVKEKLAKYGLSVDDLGKFTNAVKWVSEADYDANEIINTYSGYRYMRTVTQNMWASLDIQQKNLTGLEEKNASLEKSIASHNRTISELKELAQMGLGIKELQTIRSTIIEIAKANELDVNLAWKKYFKDLEKYDAKLGLETEIKDQRIQLRKIIFLIHNLSEYLGILVPDSFQTNMVQGYKALVANILDIQPNIVERVATQMEQSTIYKKKRIVDTHIGDRPREVRNGYIKGPDLREKGEQHSRRTFTPKEKEAMREIADYRNLLNADREREQNRIIEEGRRPA